MQQGTFFFFVTFSNYQLEKRESVICYQTYQHFKLKSERFTIAGSPFPKEIISSFDIRHETYLCHT